MQISLATDYFDTTIACLKHAQPGMHEKYTEDSTGFDSDPGDFNYDSAVIKSLQLAWHTVYDLVRGTLTPYLKQPDQDGSLMKDKRQSFRDEIIRQIGRMSRKVNRDYVKTFFLKKPQHYQQRWVQEI